MRKLWSGSADSLADLDAVAAAIAQLLPPSGVICLRGELGAGKTTLTSMLCRRIGVLDTVSSPTFAIVNEYQRADGNPVFHLDCYRLDGLEEAAEIGCEEYFYTAGALSIVEWPEVVEPLLPRPRIEVRIGVCGERRELGVYELYEE